MSNESNDHRRFAVVVYPGPDVGTGAQSGGAICMGYYEHRDDAIARADNLKLQSPGSTPLVYKLIDP